MNKTSINQESIIPCIVASHIVLTKKNGLLSNNPLDIVINEFSSKKGMDTFIKNTNTLNLVTLASFGKPYKLILFFGTLLEFNTYINTDEDFTC